MCKDTDIRLNDKERPSIHGQKAANILKDRQTMDRQMDSSDRRIKKRPNRQTDRQPTDRQMDDRHKTKAL